MVHFGSIPFSLRKEKYKHYQFLKNVNREILFWNEGDNNIAILIEEMNHSNVSWDMYLATIDDYKTWDRSMSSEDLYELGLIKKKESYKRYLDTINWDYCCNDGTEQTEFVDMSDRWDLIL